ncbi:MAG: PASTA domain-containing protein [Gemmatimonadales bacterium]
MRMRRHTTPGFSLPAGTRWRRVLRDGGLVLLTFAVGYAISVLWLSPSAVLGEDHPVPRVLGLPAATARAKIAELGFRPRLDGDRPSPSVPRGSVIWQDPPPGMVLTPNTTVQLVVSSGPQSVTVPDVIGMALSSAEKIFDAAGVKVGVVDTVRGGGELGVVIATRPAPGNGRPRGSAVDLVVSGGGS